MWQSEMSQQKPQIGNVTGEVNDVMPGSAEDLGIWKKAVGWDLNSEQESRLSGLAAARPVVCSGGRTCGGQMEKSA